MSGIEEAAAAVAIVIAALDKVSQVAKDIKDAADSVATAADAIGHMFVTIGDTLGHLFGKGQSGSEGLSDVQYKKILDAIDTATKAILSEIHAVEVAQHMSTVRAIADWYNVQALRIGETPLTAKEIVKPEGHLHSLSELDGLIFELNIDRNWILDRGSLALEPIALFHLILAVATLHTHLSALAEAVYFVTTGSADAAHQLTSSLAATEVLVNGWVASYRLKRQAGLQLEAVITRWKKTAKPGEPELQERALPVGPRALEATRELRLYRPSYTMVPYYEGEWRVKADPSADVLFPSLVGQIYSEQLPRPPFEYPVPQGYTPVGPAFDSFFKMGEVCGNQIPSMLEKLAAAKASAVIEVTSVGAPVLD